MSGPYQLTGLPSNATGPVHYAGQSIEKKKTKEITKCEKQDKKPNKNTILFHYDYPQHDHYPLIVRVYYLLGLYLTGNYPCMYLCTEICLKLGVCKTLTFVIRH